MLALSQQSADLGFVLGAPLLGAVVGISASIAGMMLPNLFKATKGIIDLDDSISVLTKNFDKLTKAQQAVARNVLTEKLKEQQKVALGLAKEVNVIQSELVSLQNASEGANILEGIFGDSQEELEAKLAKVKGSLVTVRLEMKETTETLNGLGGNAEKFKKSSESITEGLTSQIIALSAGEEAALRYNIAQELGLKVGEEIPANISAQIDAIYALRDAKEEAAIADAEARELEIDALKGEAQIQAIADRFKGEEELLTEKLERELEIIGKNNELKLQLEDEYLMAIVEMDRKAEEEKAKINEKAAKDKISLDEKRQKTEQSLERKNISSIMSITSAILGHNDTLGKLLFIGSQALSASEVFFNTQVASMKAIAELGPVAGPPVAASIQASGNLSIAAIAATTLGSLAGGGGGSSISSGGASSSSQQQQSDFAPETSTLDITEQTEEGIQEMRLVITDESGNLFLDGIAGGLEERTRQGR